MNRLSQILNLIKVRRGQKPSSQNHNRPRNYKLNHNISANIRDLTNTIANEATTNRNEQTKEDKFNRSIEIVTLFFVIITAYFFYKQNEISYEAMVDARKAATEQQRLANESNKITREAYTRVQRAFLAVNDLKPTPIKDKNDVIQGWDYIPIIKNSGNTPATSVSYIVLNPATDEGAKVNKDMAHNNYYMLSYRIKAPQDPEDVWNNPSSFVQSQVIRNNFISPQQEVEAIYNWPFHTSLEDLKNNKLLSGEYGEFIFGSIHYIDVFDKSHTTKFCFIIGGMEVNNGITQPIKPSRCLHWNCIDDQCDVDKKTYNAKFKEESEKIRINKSLGD